MTTLPFRAYSNLGVQLANKEVDFDSDSFVMKLLTSTYTPNYDTHSHASDLTNELATAAGYTAGGAALASLSKTLTVANSWGVSAAISTAYNLGDIVRPATGNGFLYRASVAGTSSGTAPTWPTVIGTTVTDGSVTWECIARAIIVWTAAAVTWATATFTGARYAAIVDTQTGTTSTEPLIALGDFGSDQAGTGGNFTINPDSHNGFLTLLV